MEAPWYQHPDKRTPEELVQLAAGWKEPRKVSIHGPEPDTSEAAEHARGAMTTA